MTAPIDQVLFELPSRVTLGPPSVAHGAAIHALIGRCKPLDVNSTYAYLLLCEHFAATCVRAEAAGETVGFVSAYRPPAKPEVIFVWQVAVDSRLRGKGLAAQMLHELLGRDAVKECNWLETTVSPSNAPSRRLFRSLAGTLGAQMTERVLFCEDYFENEGHEQEDLIRIGPLRSK